jgi:bla regulator protein blaR1
MVHVFVGYAFESTITLAVLFACYWLWLRKTTFFYVNRVLLLLMMAGTIGLPLLSRFVINDHTTSIHIIKEISKKASQYFNAPVINKAKEIPANNQVMSNIEKYVALVPLLAGVIYGLGFLFCASRIIYQVAFLYRMARNFPKKPYKNYILVYPDRDGSPFSFFNWIFLHQGTYRESQLQNILGHELAHARGFHTVDILLSELFAAVLWFHPVAWLLRVQVQLNLEYIADRELLREGARRKDYQYDLLNIGFAGSFNRTVSHFNYQHLKKRIMMMNSKPSGKNLLWKYFLVVPVIFLLVSFIGPLNSGNNQLAVESTGVTVNPSNMDIYLVIRDDMSEHQLQKIKNYLSEEGIDISFSEVKYNQQGLLCGIRMIVNQGNTLLGDMTVPNSPHSLSTPLVFYLLRSEKDKSGVSWGYPKGLTENDLNILGSLNGLLKYDRSTKQFDIHGSAHIAG